MGSSASINVSGSNTIRNSHNIISGNVISAGHGISLSSAPPPRGRNAITPAKVLNASRNPVRIYLDEAKLELSDLTFQKRSMTCFRTNPPIPFRTIPPLGSLTLEVGDDLASVFVQDEHNPEFVVSTICVSSPVPQSRSFIVTHDYQIKLQSQTVGNKWMDEDGTDHTPM